jgi:hypothetical protein
VKLALALLWSLAQPLSDIDAFMERVLERRKVNWEDYYNYFCSERAELSIEGSLESAPIQGFQREHLWFVRDGYLVRSPVSVDGVRVSAAEREREEREWIERLKKREAERGPDRESFFGFEFEPGNYFYAGRELVEGHEVAVVEYFPEQAFGSDDEGDGEEDDELEAKLNKVFLVTLYIDPEEHQIVRMTLDNAGFDFLPARWLVQLDTIEATLTMHEPFEGVWLARDIEAFGRVTTAAGDLSIRYQSNFYDCVRAQVGTTYRFPPRGSEPK